MAKDLFSAQSKNYALYRPSYPPELFDYILSFVVEKNAAWDCATGNGQAAVVLSEYFTKVIASDISQKQLEQAVVKDNIEYVCCPAEKTPFPANSFNLITVAQAYHWLDWKKFHEEATRVAKTNCIVAVWMYDLLVSDEKPLHDLIRHFYRNITGPYWDAERRHVDEHYANVLFDFTPLPSKDFFIGVSFTKEHLLGYFSTWSATQNFIKAKGYSPRDEIKNKLHELWPDDNSKPFHFPLILKMGKVIK